MGAPNGYCWGSLHRTRLGGLVAGAPVVAVPVGGAGKPGAGGTGGVMLVDRSNTANGMVWLPGIWFGVAALALGTCSTIVAGPSPAGPMKAAGPAALAVAGAWPASGAGITAAGDGTGGGPVATSGLLPAAGLVAADGASGTTRLDDMAGSGCPKSKAQWLLGRIWLQSNQKILLLCKHLLSRNWKMPNGKSKKPRLQWKLNLQSPSFRLHWGWGLGT